ncbi:MAG: PAS domain S-box protein [Desulfovibrionales bacterium]
MSRRSEPDKQQLRDKIIGLGERSIRKSYYPMLQERMAELERFRALLDQTKDAIFLMEAGTGRFVDVNQSACTQMGYSREELFSMRVDSLWTLPVAEKVRQLFAVSSPEGRRTTVEAEIAARQGSFPAEITLRLVHFNDQDYVVAVARDITARKKAEQELREAEQKYRSIFENAVAGIFQVSVAGQILSANQTMAQIFGYASPEELISSVHDIGTELYVDPTERQILLERIKQQGQVTDFEARFRRRDSTVIWGSLHVRPVFGKDGSLIYTEGFFQDISRRKQAEEEKTRLEGQLMQSQKMEAVGTLAGGIAHDFNNLLQAISGYIQLLLLRKDENDHDRTYLVEIQGVVARATDLVRRLLTFSRKMEIKLSRVDMNEIIRSALGLIERTIPKMISIETRLDPECRDITADPTQMEQVLINLVNNAVDALPEGGKIRIETRHVAIETKSQARSLDMHPGDYMLLTVADNGVGMDKQTRDHIFEPFFTTKEVGKGTGLGLSTVYGIIKGHRGYIECSSAPGKGTMFSIYIPEQIEEQETAGAETKSNSKITGGTETILMVDDERIILEIGQDMLGFYGYDLLVAGSGEEALQIYRRERNRIDLVVLDLGMPGMGGERCLEELLSISPELPVVVSSGYTMHKIAKNPEQFGARRFLPKPFRLEELLGTIRQVLNESR